SIFRFLAMSPTRQLAAIMFTDIVGYTAFMQQDEEKALDIIKHYNATLDKYVSQFNGRVSNFYGDGSLCIFSSATDAVNASLCVQKELGTEPVVPLRIGIHIGEVFFEDGKALGDGVNVASRVQSLGQANTIFISAEVYDKIKNNPAFNAISLGYFEFKNVHKPLEVLALTNEGLFVPARKKLGGKLKQKKSFWRQPLVMSISIALLLVVAWFIYKTWAKIPAVDLSEKTIAVLPFMDMSRDKSQEYFGDGLAEEIINSLTTIRELRVIGRTSSFQFKGKNIDLTEIGKKLKAGIVLEGSVQQSGNRARITAQLIRVKDNSHIWSQRYDRDLTDIFKVQDDIALHITEKLKLSLTALEKKQLSMQETAPEAYTLYLKGLHAYRQQAFEQSIAFNMQAIQIDPVFALPYAYIALAKAWIIHRAEDYKNQPALLDAKQFALKAIQLAPKLAEAYSALGLISWRIEREFTQAREYFEKSISLNPNASLIQNRYGYFLTWMGEFEKAKKLALSAIESDPIDLNSYSILITANQFNGQYREAGQYVRESLQLFPENTSFQTMWVFNTYLEGRYTEFIQQCDSMLRINKPKDPWLMALLSMAYFKTGNREASNRILHQLKALSRDSVSNANYFTAEAFSVRNEPDSSIAWLQKSLDKLEPRLSHLKISPFFDPLRKLPAFQKIYRDYGFED
ncbi:MAG TPA: adenylate/guanylate cyclase domain-containing protein, partial [Chitinophagaceae bacterium]|nr:adenylate/guanylate cyclase domain-containing protein [Chitinophagaceae bacterium]